jgi:hypothetical protein
LVVKQSIKESFMFALGIKSLAGLLIFALWPLSVRRKIIQNLCDLRGSAVQYYQ